MVLPDADTIKPAQQGILSLSKKLSKQAQTGTTLPVLQKSSLISLGQLCGEDCTVVLNTKLYAIKEDEVILQGQRNFTDGLLDIPIQKTILQEENYMILELHCCTYTTPPKNICKQQTKKRVDKNDYILNVF